MRKRLALFVALLSIVPLLFAGGSKEVDMSWCKDYLPEEQELALYYEFEDKDLTSVQYLDPFLDDLADVHFYGTRESKIHKQDRTGFLRKAYDDPLHVLDYIDKYLTSLSFAEINKKWEILPATYNNWVLESMWKNTLLQTAEIKDAAASKLYSEFSLTDIYTADQVNAAAKYAGFTDKLIVSGNGLVGTALVIDVLSFGDYLLNATQTPVFNQNELYEMLNERFNDDVKAINKQNINVDAANKAIIEDLKASLHRYSEIMYRYHWLDETYISYYYQPDFDNRVGKNIKDYNMGIGASAGYGYMGAAISGFINQVDITGYVGNSNFEDNVAFGFSTQYNMIVKNGNHFGFGVSLNAVYSMDINNQYYSEDYYDPYYGGYVDSSYNHRYEENSPFTLRMGIPISYKYFFQSVPILLTVTLEPGFTVLPNAFTFDGIATVGLQYVF